MIDEFVILAPLILLPIILLSIFIGCVLDSEGATYVPIHLVYGPGFETGVESIEVTFQFEPPSGEGLVDRSRTVTIDKEDIDPNGDVITAWDIMFLSDEGVVECTCVIAPPQTPVPFTGCLKEKNEDFTSRFKLSRDGDSFDLTCEELPMTGEVG